MRNIPLACPAVGPEEFDAIKAPMQSGWLTQGKQTEAFEAEFAEYHGMKNAVAVSSCTTGLHLALLSLGIGPGDEVIVPSFTWVATANAVEYTGAKPVFCDIDIETFLMSGSDVLKRLSPATRAIIPVHLFGLCIDVPTLKRTLPENIHIVEDAACAAGASTAHGFAGSFGAMGVFSFHPRKTITTGEGGMITLNNAETTRHLRQLRDHGAKLSDLAREECGKPYEMAEFDELGFNYRMTDLQGALGRAQLKRLHHFIAERDRIARVYNEAFSEIDWLNTPPVPTEGNHGWQAYVLYVDPENCPKHRNEIMLKLAEKGIGTRPGTHAVHTLSYYRKKYGIQPSDFANSLSAANNSMAIPLHNMLTDDDVGYIVDAIKSIA
ncbi:MAG: DegT/DnrJ/EryC1/StrS family aminotransferase [Rhodospirillales bacterium]|nr:DegT/DnrJ/EryC1/StrS family aminotransferase [Rhodospirillales bacterium]